MFAERVELEHLRLENRRLRYEVSRLESELANLRDRTRVAESRVKALNLDPFEAAFREVYGTRR